MENRVTESYNYNVICKVCGWKLKASDAKRRWDGLEPVCPVTCWEPRHPLDFYKQRSDFHKLPYVSPEPAANDLHTMFEPNYAPEDIVLSAVGANFGNRFTSLTDGYIDAVSIFVGVEPAAGRVLLQDRNLYIASLWLNSGPTKLWEKQVYLQPGQWNNVPVTPNVSVAASTDYTVVFYRAAGTPLSYVTPRRTIAAQPYMDYLSSRYNLTGVSQYPTVDDVTNLYLINASVRPT